MRACEVCGAEIRGPYQFRCEDCQADRWAAQHIPGSSGSVMGSQFFKYIGATEEPEGELVEEPANKRAR
jgi:hypothetical protein